MITRSIKSPNEGEQQIAIGLNSEDVNLLQAGNVCQVNAKEYNTKVVVFIGGDTNEELEEVFLRMFRNPTTEEEG